jgi:uncharacterized membrane protein
MPEGTEGIEDEPSTEVVRSKQVKADEPQLPGLESFLQVAQSSSWTGPLPPPAALAEYAKILPDAPERILGMAERDLDSRIAREEKLVNAAVETGRTGQAAAILLAFVAVIAAIVFFALRNEVAGGILLSLPVVMLVRALLGQLNGNGQTKGDGDSH